MVTVENKGETPRFRIGEGGDGGRALLVEQGTIRFEIRSDGGVWAPFRYDKEAADKIGWVERRTDGPRLFWDTRFAQGYSVAWVRLITVAAELWVGTSWSPTVEDREYARAHAREAGYLDGE